jgi:outer membrane cobalamin receptor
VTASYRRSDYSTGHKTDSYGFGVEWAPIQMAKLRFSYQRAARAANVVELFTPQGIEPVRHVERPMRRPDAGSSAQRNAH